MTIHAHIEDFAGLPVQEYSAAKAISSPGERAFRVTMDWEAIDGGESFVDLFASFVADPACPNVRALIIGSWGEVGDSDGSTAVVEALVSARERLPELRALFVGEITVEESEISWIVQSDVSPLFEAFPNLEELWLRGGNGLALGRPQHARLKKLVVQTGGLPATIVRELASAVLPELEHLELWLGDDGYGNDVTHDDLAQVLSAELFPKLKYLGLRDDYDADETARLLTEIDLPASIEILDLSLGTLGDEGAKALASSSRIKALKKLDLHFHYVSPEVVKQLEQLGPEIDAGDVQQPDDWGDGEMHRYVAVAE